MPSFLVESRHTQEDCIRAFDHVLAAGYLSHFQWGCKAGDHTGFVIIEAADRAEALMVVPTFARDKARVVEVTQFTKAQIEAMHEEALKKRAKG